MILRTTPLLLVLALVGLAYSQVLNGPLVFDDHHSITLNPAIQIDTLSWHNLYQAAVSSPLPNRALANISFALNHWAGGLDTFGFHLTNILIHGFNTLLLFVFTHKLAQLARLESRQAVLLALLCSAIWALHPLQTQAVSYIVQRMTELALTFSLLALLFYLQGRAQTSRRKATLFYLATLLSGLLGMASKENAALLPFALLLTEWLFFQQGQARWLKRQVGLLTLFVAILIAAGMLYTHGQMLDHILGGYQYRDFTLEQRLLTEPRVIFHLLGLWIYPDPSLFNLDYDFPLSYSLFDPLSTGLSLLALISLLAVGFWLAPRNPLPALGVLWLLLWLSLESSFLPLEIIFEHRMYQPSIGLALISAWLLVRWFPFPLSAAIGIALTLALSWATWERNKVWADEVTLWQHVAAKSPNKSRVHALLGTALMDRGNTSAAIDSLQKAITLNPGNINARNNLAKLYAQQGKFALAKQQLLAAQQGAPRNLDVQYNLVALDFQQLKLRQAAKRLKHILKLDKKQLQAHLRLALIYREWVNLSKAASHLQTAIELAPNEPQAYLLLADIRQQQNRNSAAIKRYRQALKLLPADSKEAKNVAHKIDELRQP